MNYLKYLVVVAAFFLTGVAVGQCIIPTPVVPPQATMVCYNLPLDGGTTGCTGNAVGTGPALSQTHAIGPAMCAAVVQSGNRLHSLDNNWSDGGVP